MKLFRILLAIISAFIFIGIVGAVILVTLFDPNHLKPIIIAKVKQQTGYQLAITGNLSWSFYPTLGIKIEKMTFTAPAQTTPFVDLREVKIAAGLSQFLQRKEILLGDLYITEAVLANLHVQKIYVGLQWTNKILTMQPITASLYSGSLEGSAHGVQLATTPKWDWDVQLTRIQVEPLLKDFDPSSKLKFSGLGQIKLKAQTQGKSKAEILNHLNGTSTFAINNGILYGIDLNYLVQTTDALINKKVATVPNTNQTAFEGITGAAVITNGIAKINQLLITTPTFIARTDGKINLITQDLDLQMQVNAQQILRTQWEIPILVTGNLSHPDVRLDSREIQKMFVKKEFEKTKTKVQKEIQRHIPGKAGELLQKLFH